MASFLRRKRARYTQSDAAAAAQCDSQADICTEDWEDYVVVTVDPRPEQPVNKHRVCSLESSLDSGYEEVHMPPPTPTPAPATSSASATATGTEEDTAAGAGSISASRKDEARQQEETDGERPVCRTDRDLGQHHGFFGQRYYKYDDTECEGNRYITDEEL